MAAGVECDLDAGGFHPGSGRAGSRRGQALSVDRARARSIPRSGTPPREPRRSRRRAPRAIAPGAPASSAGSPPRGRHPASRGTTSGAGIPPARGNAEGRTSGSPRLARRAAAGAARPPPGSSGSRYPPAASSIVEEEHVAALGHGGRFAASRAREAGRCELACDDRRFAAPALLAGQEWDHTRVGEQRRVVRVDGVRDRRAPARPEDDVAHGGAQRYRRTPHARRWSPRTSGSACHPYALPGRERVRVGGANVDALDRSEGVHAATMLVPRGGTVRPSCRGSSRRCPRSRLSLDSTNHGGSRRLPGPAAVAVVSSPCPGRHREGDATTASSPLPQPPSARAAVHRDRDRGASRRRRRHRVRDGSCFRRPSRRHQLPPRRPPLPAAATPPPVPPPPVLAATATPRHRWPATTATTGAAAAAAAGSSTATATSAAAAARRRFLRHHRCHRHRRPPVPPPPVPPPPPPAAAVPPAPVPPPGHRQPPVPEGFRSPLRSRPLCGGGFAGG